MLWNIVSLARQRLCWSVGQSNLSHIWHASLSLIVTSDIPHSRPLYPLYLVYMVLLVRIPYCVSIHNTWSDDWLIGLFFNHLWGIGNVPSDHVKISTCLRCYLLYVRSPAHITGKLQPKVCLLIHMGEFYSTHLIMINDYLLLLGDSQNWALMWVEGHFHFSDHWTIVSKSGWRVMLSISVFICLSRMPSSANNLMVEFIPWPKSFLYNKNRRGRELCLVELQMACRLRLMYHHQPLQTEYMLWASCFSTVRYFLSCHSSSTYGVVSGVLQCQMLLKRPALGSMSVTNAWT